MNILFTEIVVSADQDSEVVDIFSASEHLNREHSKNHYRVVTDTASYLHNFVAQTLIN